MQDYAYNNEDLFKRKEKIDGKIYMMAAPSEEHIDVQYNITNIFNDYFRKNKKRCVSRSDAQLNMDNINYFRPDIMVFCYDTNRHIPVIIIEILSKSTRNTDLGVKMKKYAEIGIKEYWIVDLENMSIDIYLITEEKKYEFYKSYAHFTKEDLSRELDEDEREKSIKEFSPVSMPELNIQIEDVFYFVD